MSTLRSRNIQDGSYFISAETVIRGSNKAWVNFNGTGVVAIRSSFACSAVTDHGLGDYSLSFFLETPYIGNNNQDMFAGQFGFILTTGGTADAYVHRTVEDLPAARTLTTVRFYVTTSSGSSNIDAAQITGVYWR